MRHAVAVWRRLAGARVRGDLQYRASFAAFLVAQAASALLDLAAIVVLFGQVPRLAGWSLAEVAFLYGLAGTGFALADVFVSPVELLAQRIRDGSFDRVLLRPAGGLLQVVADGFALRRVGKLAQAVVVLVVATASVDVDWTAAAAAVVLLAVGSAAVVFGALWVAGATVSFWAVGSAELANSVTYGGGVAAQYPMTVYGPVLRRVLAVPFSFVAYVPALLVLGRDERPWPVLLVPVVAAGTCAVAWAAWRAGVRHHRSTGS